MEKFFNDDVQAFTKALTDLESRLDPTAKPDRDDNYDATVEAFERTCAACRRMEAALADEPENLKQAKTRFLQTIRPWLDRSWFFQRAIAKPRGYPGDRELLTAIYDNVPRGRGLIGYLDLYFLNLTLARAIRERLLCARPS